MNNIYDLLDKYTCNIRPFSGEPARGLDGLYHFVYCIVNKANSKFYIGKHTTKNLNDGYLGSGYHIQNSVNKYGPENFTYFPVEFFTTSDLAYEKEVSLITENMVKSKECFNWKGGGEGFGSYETNPVHQQIKQGKNLFFTDNPVYEQTLKGKNEFVNGTHPNIIKNLERWKKENPSTQKIINNDHHFLGETNPAKIAKSKGLPWGCSDKPWNHIRATEISISMWKQSDLLYNIIINNKQLSTRKLYKKCRESLTLGFSKRVLSTIISKIEDGWIPTQDSKWIEFKNSYNN